MNESSVPYLFVECFIVFNFNYGLTENVLNIFRVWKYIIVKRWVKSQILLFPSLLEQTRNRTNMPTQSYKEMVSSVLFCWVFHYVDFQCFGDLKISGLKVLSVLYFFIECFIIFIFSTLGNWNHLPVLGNILSISDDWNLKFSFSKLIRTYAQSYKHAYSKL